MEQPAMNPFKVLFHHISYFFITSVVMENCPQEPCPRTMALPSKIVFFERFVWSTHPPNLKNMEKNTRPAAELLQDILPFTKSWYEIAWKGPGADESRVVLWLHWCLYWAITWLVATPPKLTCYLKKATWKREKIYTPPILGFHVSVWGCISWVYPG